MLAVCAGNRGCGSYEGMTCDAGRGNTPIVTDPRNASISNLIRYKSNGEITSDDPAIHKELVDVLGLNSNAVSLPQSRKAALDAMIRHIRDTHPKGDIRTYCEKMIQRLTHAEKKTPYVGILIEWLKKHLK